MLPSFLAVTAAALALEATLGYPDRLFRLIRHPVVWIGTLVSALDRRLPRTRSAGTLATLLVLAATVGTTAAVTIAATALLPPWPALLLLALLASALPAERSLHDHVRAVADALDQGLPQARAAVSHIVGRDPDRLDAPAVARAAVESLAENFSDGVVGPAFWGCLGGLPGMAAYKAANTLDSMVGHRTPRHERFGWFSARLDDWLNLVPSRLSAVWLILAALTLPGADARNAWRAVRRDARHHRSPSAGWPEAAMAGALNLRLAGPRSYGGVPSTDGWMGNGRAELTAGDIRRALVLFRRACNIQVAAIVLLILILPR